MFYITGIVGCEIRQCCWPILKLVTDRNIVGFEACSCRDSIYIGTINNSQENPLYITAGKVCVSFHARWYATCLVLHVLLRIIPPI